MVPPKDKKRSSESIPPCRLRKEEEKEYTSTSKENYKSKKSKSQKEKDKPLGITELHDERTYHDNELKKRVKYREKSPSPSSKSYEINDARTYFNEELTHEYLNDYWYYPESRPSSPKKETKPNKCSTMSKPGSSKKKHSSRFSSVPQEMDVEKFQNYMWYNYYTEKKETPSIPTPRAPPPPPPPPPEKKKCCGGKTKNKSEPSVTSSKSSKSSVSSKVSSRKKSPNRKKSPIPKKESITTLNSPTQQKKKCCGGKTKNKYEPSVTSSKSSKSSASSKVSSRKKSPKRRKSSTPKRESITTVNSHSSKRSKYHNDCRCIKTDCNCHFIKTTDPATSWLNCFSSSED